MAVRKRRVSLKTWLLMCLVVGGVFGGLEYYFVTYLPNHGPAEATSLETWQQWGMAIQYPSSLSAHYHGVLEPNATSNSGGVQWWWNDGWTYLFLTWQPGADYVYSEMFRNAYVNLQSNHQNVSILDQGSITMASSTWQYQTYQGTQGGTIQFFAYAISYYSGSQRVYSIVFADTHQDTLDALQYYGKTFTG